MDNSFFKFAQMVSYRLLGWSAASVAVGSWLMRRSGSLIRAVGIQFVVWGLIDAAIAGFGLYNNRRSAQSDKAGDPEFVEQESGKLRRLLWINGGLDVLYLWGGAWLFRRGQQKNRPGWRGHGLGVIIQGGFLLIFDAWHALQLTLEDKGNSG